MCTRCFTNRLLIPMVIGLAVICLPSGAIAGPAVDGLLPRWVRPKPLVSEWREGWHRNLVVLKCAEGSGVRLRDGELVSLSGTSLQGLHQALEAHLPTVRRLFSRAESVLDLERIAGQQASGRELADLNLYYLLTAVPGGNTGLLVDDLNALAVVEMAYFEPVAQRGSIHLETQGQRSATAGRKTTTPDFSVLQDYLRPAPLGLDALYAWSLPGGLGEGVRLGVVERGLNLNHEDLPRPESYAGEKKDVDHGTAVMGEIFGEHNGIGISGIAPETEMHLAIFDTLPPFPVIADALNALWPWLGPGDVLLIEYHAPGPPSNKPCNCSCISHEYIPLEYWQANFDVIAAFVASQVICVEIAGNGGMDLDHPRYFQTFDRTARDSGAIIVGGADPGSGEPTCWTNHGSRIDLHAHGSAIVTAGYGTLYDGGPSATYTDFFGGTSGAGAMTAGAVCSLQGWHKARTGFSLDPAALRQLLRQSGWPQAPDNRQVGPLPDLRAAISGQILHLRPVGQSE